MIKLKIDHFTYDSGNEGGIKNINLRIPKGQCVIVTGKSGCGKTTLLRLINKLIPQFYSGNLDGELYIDGKNINEYTTDDLIVKVGCVFQNPKSQFFNVDTTSEIAFGCENLGISRSELHKRVNDTAKALNITHLLNKSIFSLSGGEKQMIAIASAYAMGVDILLMDEPSANLDAVATKQLQDMIWKLKQQGKTIIIAEHRLYYLKNVADRMIILDNGEISKDLLEKDFSLFTTENFHNLGLRALDFKEPSNKKENDIVECSDNILIKELNVGYKHGQNIVKDFSVTLNRGEIIGIIGHNGQGKSTFVKCLCGMIKEKKGEIIYRNKNFPCKKRLGKIYLVFQDTTSQLFSDSVIGELELASKTAKEYCGLSNNQVLKMLSLSHLCHRHPMSLSGGEKQRLAIAVGIVQNADVIILDEPTSGLDYSSMQDVKKVMKMLKNQGKYVIIITHDFEFLTTTCDRVMLIKNGRLIGSRFNDSENLPYIRNHFLV